MTINKTDRHTDDDGGLNRLLSASIACKKRHENTRDLYNGPTQNCARIDLSSQVLANIDVACIYSYGPFSVINVLTNLSVNYTFAG